MNPTIRFVFLTALRDRLLVSLFALLALTFAVSAYLGSAAVAEAQQATVVYAAGAVRFALVFGLIVFVAFHMERLYETREIEAVLSRAISREAFVLFYWMGIVAVAALVLVPAVAVLFFFQLSLQGMAVWAVTVLVEVLVMVAFAIFCGMTMGRAIPTVFTALGFYALARLVGLFAGIASNISEKGVNRVANPIMEGLGYLVPRLDLAGQTRWLVYGIDDLFIPAIVVLQGAVYVPLLLAATMFDLRRKQF